MGFKISEMVAIKNLAMRLVWILLLAAACTTALRPLKGVSESGAEFGSHLPGSVDHDYTWPRSASIQHFAAAGMGVVRIPFLWERLQPKLNGGFVPAYLAALDRAVHEVTSLNMSAVIDPHNYARFCPGHEAKNSDPSGPCKVIGNPGVPITAFTDGLWGRLAKHYAACELCVFAIMNEPNTMSTAVWAQTATKAVAAIRAAGATNQLVLVPGNGWTGAHSWLESWVDSSPNKLSNAAAFDNFSDPSDNWAFEMHQYLDKDSRGASSTCVSATVGVAALTNVTGWLEERGYRAWIGEFGAADNELCHSAVDNMLGYMEEHSSAWLGWSWWAAGPWWGTAAMSIEPNADGSDKPQFEWLRKYFPIAPPTPPPTPDPCNAIWSKCGGKGWTGPKCCDAGCTCTPQNPSYSQCKPRAGKHTCT